MLLRQMKIYFELGRGNMQNINYYQLCCGIPIGFFRWGVSRGPAQSADSTFQSPCPEAQIRLCETLLE